MTDLQIKYFLTTARCLNFSEAARQLYITQPALSQQIASIEADLNMQLFYRVKGRVYLTPAGVILLHELPRYEKLYETIIDRAKIANEGCSGMVSIVFTEGQGIPKNLLERFVSFREKHPNIAVDVRCASFGKIQTLLTENTVDLAYMPEFLIDQNPVYMTERVAAYPGVAIISKKHPLAKEKIQSLKQLKNETFLFLRDEESDRLNELMLKDCAEAGFVPNVKYVSSIDENILSVELGLGVGFTNEESYGCLSKNIVRLKGIHLGKQYYVFAWKKSRDNPNIALFVNHMIQEDS